MDESRNIYLIGAFLIINCLLKNTLAIESIAGQRQPCKNEGEEFETKDFNCFKCICQNGFVECESEQCPSVQDCYYLETKKPGGCCERCKECSFNGTSYMSGKEWTDPEDPCMSYKCVAGVVTKTNLQCYTPCSQPSPPKPGSGQCCPTCIGCKYNGQIVHEGQDVTSSDDPCLKCSCTNKRLVCVKKACPVLHCPPSKQVKERGECCPRCSEKREVGYSIPGKCILGKGFHNNDSKFTPDHCTSCVCMNGTSLCRRDTCPVLECQREFQVQLPEECCPRCPEPSQLVSVCMYNGTTYQHEETWNMDSCRSCQCVNGRINCAETKCPEVRCRPNETKVTVPGQCCAKCEETAGICTVFGDPHYKTFDGKFYSFQGSCKYQLTADCEGHTFSIRVTNDDRNTKSSSWTKTVTLKIGNLKVNLGQKMRVKVNGTRVKLPYILHSQDMIHMHHSHHQHHHQQQQHQRDNQLITNNLHPVSYLARNISSNEIPEAPELEIVMTEEGVSVNTRIGIRLLWDGTNFLQVQAPVSYKRKLCGLCGNYNNVYRDDLKTRRGVLLNETSIWRFANSWRVGGTKSCMRNNENFGRHSDCKNPKYVKKGLRFCKPLNDSNSIFGNCSVRLNPTNYFESCRKDMCECDTNLCFCESFAAYAHECQRLGVPLANWRQETGCSLQNMFMSAVRSSKKENNRFTSPRNNRLDPLIPDVFQPHRERHNRNNTITRQQNHRPKHHKNKNNNLNIKPILPNKILKWPRKNRTPPPIH